MSKSSKDSVSTSSESARGSRKRPGGKQPASLPPSQIDELTEDLIGSMKRLSRDAARRKKVAKKLF